MDRATTRPAHVRPPDHWAKDVPVPAPQPIPEDRDAAGHGGRDPTRYGDWEDKGMAIDF